MLVVEDLQPLEVVVEVVERGLVVAGYPLVEVVVVDYLLVVVAAGYLLVVVVAGYLADPVGECLLLTYCYFLIRIRLRY